MHGKWVVVKEKFVNNLTNFVIKNKECDELKIKTIRYGLEGLYLSLTKIFVVIILVILTNSFWEFLSLFIFYQLIRKYSFGLHATSSLACWMTTIPIYVGGSLIIKYLEFNIWLCYIICLLALVSFMLWAPADTPKRPLIRAKQRKEQKFKTCLITILYFITIFFVKNKMIVDAITLSLIIQMIMVNPIIYKITNTQFNNYKLYPSKV